MSKPNANHGSAGNTKTHAQPPKKSKKPSKKQASKKSTVGKAASVEKLSKNPVRKTPKTGSPKLQLAKKKVASKKAVKSTATKPAGVKKKVPSLKAIGKPSTAKKISPQAKPIPGYKRRTSLVDFLNALHHKNAFEIRIFDTVKTPDSTTVGVKSGYFDSVACAKAAIAKAEQCKPPGVFVTLNPVPDDIVGRARNYLIFRPAKSTKDKEIERRTWLFIDVDSIRPSGQSATLHEVKAARQKTLDVKAYLDSKGFPPPLIAFSGNGYHLLYRIELENTPDYKELIKRFLTAMAAQFDDDAVKIDRSVYNASRPIRVAGTTARKGTETKDRKHRKTFFFVPQSTEIAVVPVGLLESVCAAESEANQTEPVNQHQLPVFADASSVVVERCRKYISKLKDAVAGSGGHNQTFHYACIMAKFGLSPDQATELFAEVNESKCKPPWKDAEIQHKIKDAYARVSKDGQIGTMANYHQSQDSKPDLSQVLPEAIAAEFIDFLRDANGRVPIVTWKDEVHVWRSGRYVPAGKNHLETALTQYLQDRYRKIAKTRVRDILMNVTANLQIVQDVSPPCLLPGVTTPSLQHIGKPKELYLGPTSLVNIQTGQSVASTPDVFALGCNAIDLDFTLPAPKLWLKFLDEIFECKRSIRLLRQWMGYLSVRNNEYQKALMLLGPTRSGKGTITKVIEEILGRENCCAPSAELLKDKFGLHSLIGKIVAIDNDARLSGGRRSDSLTEKILSITGDDLVDIPRKYLPTLTVRLPTRLMIVSNELPRLDDSSGVIAGRFLFLRTRRSSFGNEDSKLIEKLLPELPQIACWAAKGYQDLMDTGGFVDPPYAEELRSQLRGIASPIHLFAEDQCEFNASFWVDKTLLYKSFKRWCDDEGMQSSAPSKQMFCKGLYAAFPGVRDGRTNSSKNGKSRPHVVKGLRLGKQSVVGHQPSDVV